MPLKKLLRILLGIQFALGIGLAVLTVSLFLNQKELSQSQRSHFQSYLLGDELRQSSDDLTRLARTYVATGNEEFERQYWAVLNIRNGKIPRPAGYNRIYWDFISEQGPPPRPDDPAISLHRLMIKQGFTDAELEKLTSSQKYSDALVKTERIAMNAVKGLFDDGLGNFTVKKEPDRALAIKLMNDEAYHKNKANIMRPIDDFYAMFEARTAGEVARRERRSMLLLQSLGLVITMILGMFLYSFVVIKRQITERQRAEESLRASSHKLALHIEQTPLGFIEWDLAFRVVRWNPAAERIFGYTAAEALGKHASFIIPESAAPLVTPVLQALLEGRGGGQSENENLRKNGSVILCGWHNATLTDAAGHVVGIATQVEDITERKRSEEALRKQAGDLRASNSQLSAFNRVAVGRELRMIELKREVDELCGKLGEPPRYRNPEDETTPLA